MKFTVIEVVIATTVAIMLVVFVAGRVKPESPPCDWRDFIMVNHLEHQHGIYVDRSKAFDKCYEYMEKRYGRGSV